MYKKLSKAKLSIIFSVIFFITGYQVMAQDLKTIQGTITSAEDGMPLPGVNVFVKGTSYAAITDFDGKFLLDVPQNSVITISFVGFVTKTIEVSEDSNFNIVLETDVEALNEIVVVGYGSVKKTDLTGAVGSVGSDDLTERNMTNPLEALQGNVPGVQISNSTGRIGDGFDIVVRGKNSFGDNQPLFVVDGVPTDNIDFLNPQDIERMDILKDASSTAIYGSRGTNGVVIVTTKNGAGAKSGFNVSLESFFGVKEVARLPNMMSPDKWWQYHQSAYLETAAIDPNTGAVSAETLANAVGGGGDNAELFRRVADGDSFDWYDAVLKSGYQQNTYLNVSGRSDNGMGYNLGLGYQKETGNIENEELEKYTLKLGLDHTVNDKFSFGTNLTITKTDQNLGSSVAMRDAFRLNPYLNPYGLDGELFPLPGKLTDDNGDFIINKTSTYNPLLEIANSTNEIQRWNIIASSYFQFNFNDWLSFKSTFSSGLNQNRRGQAWGALTDTGANNRNLPSAEIEKNQNFNYTWDNQINIDKKIGEDHSFNFLGLFSQYSDETESSFQSSRFMPFETSFYNIGSGEQSTFNLGTGFIKQTITSYALRLNYSFKERYLLTLTNRWDGSSVLSESKRWDSFPSAAVAWKILEEDFFKNQNTLSNLKLRLSYGFTGNNNISPYSSKNLLNSQVFYDFNGNANNGWVPNRLANSSLDWERTREFNAGVDFGFLNSRIVGSLDIYDRLSKDILFEQDLPLETGYPFINANVGSVSNKGLELSLTTRNIQTPDVSWSTTFTFTKNTNAVESIYGQSEIDDIGNNLFIGESLDAHYNYQFTGIWQADEAEQAAGYGMEEGQEKLRDVNGDGRYTANEDRVILGSSNPDWSGSLFTSLKVKNFDLSASVITNQGVLVYSEFHSNFANTRDRGRQKLDINWYMPENDAGLAAQTSNSYPQPRNEGNFWRNNGVGYYHDASFVKVKNIALGYNFKDKILTKLKLEKLRVYANVLNPFVFTKYEGYDPEWASAPLNTGRTSSITYQFGFNLKF
ncbi:SusC/RagA family TonB-linked outer membrane protein [Mesonia aestuariivivens]|uniref:SusC/RagA family TonB-linked outer membrane protein n=1 Tax=Mesonia aestuariivivens TaxID=2796128 RepID=A0ABS6W1N9_9FLAO|nr:SusC/RagA family TonB-linked outer membrane protein [Mesonia aestuariivivens]MBW2961765.1 SusC/RagA family TonB-linked outer membrane protein [Mesonia aestuariivivens]